jgi:hypothetical protein
MKEPGQRCDSRRSNPLPAVTRLGSMGTKPALRTSKGTTFTNFDVLVKDHDRKGEEVTECYEVVAFGRVAANRRRRRDR